MATLCSHVAEQGLLDLACWQLRPPTSGANGRACSMAATLDVVARGVVHVRYAAASVASHALAAPSPRWHRHALSVSFASGLSVGLSRTFPQVVRKGAGSRLVRWEQAG